MKNKSSLFTWALAVFGMAAVLTPAMAMAATNSGAKGASVVNLTDGPDSRAVAKPKAGTKKVTYEKYETTTSSKSYKAAKSSSASAKTATGNSNRVYYIAPEQRPAATSQAVIVEETVPVAHTVSAREVKSERAETKKIAEGRKYYLLHPFFQPQKGHVGSLTDFSWGNNNYKFGDITCPGCTLNQDSGLPGWEGYSGKWDASAFSIKEDLSFGITDNLAVIGSARWSDTKYKIDWKGAADDKQHDSDFDLWGLGLQWRFVDTADWIAYIGAYYQWQEIADTFAVDAKVGYKIQDSTIYGLARVFSVHFDEKSYGNGISSKGQSLFFALETEDGKNEWYFEGGLGLFSVLAPDWHINLEAIIGNYGWHNQGSIKGAIGWQPLDCFALNLYAKTSIFDTADGKRYGIYDWMNADPSVVSYEGDAKISKYRETSIGLQVALYF